MATLKPVHVLKIARFRPHNVLSMEQIYQQRTQRYGVLMPRHLRKLVCQKLKEPPRAVEKGLPLIDREKRMKEDQDWTAVYPGPAAFKPSVVPLPIRMGYPKRKAPPPGKYANQELTKIPNFLHLTPVAIKKHCSVLKEFCTEFPSNLKSDEAKDKHFPLQLATYDYIFSSNSLRHPKARIIELEINLDNLVLDRHAKEKFIQLVGKRYDRMTNKLKITVDRCPARSQNLEYSMYLLTVLYHQSWKKEDWEDVVTDEERFFFNWETSEVKKSLVNYLSRVEDKEPATVDGEIKGKPETETIKEVFTKTFEEGEDRESILKYREAVLNLLHGTVIKDQPVSQSN